MAESSHILAALMIVALFLSTLIFVEINRMEQARKTTLDVQTFSEEKRLEMSLDSLLKMTESNSGETIAELIADYVHYGKDTLKFGEKDVNIPKTIKSLFDSFYGPENYYLKLPEIKKGSRANVEIHFIMDTSGSMYNDFSSIGKSIDYINNKTGQAVKFFIHSLAWGHNIPQCQYPNVVCDVFNKKDISKFAGGCELGDAPEAYGLGIALWASLYPTDADVDRILIPASDELSGSSGYPKSAKRADCHMDVAIASLKNHKKVFIYPMIATTYVGDYLAILADMKKLANATNGQVMDFHKGYSQAELNKVLSQIIIHHGGKVKAFTEFGVKKEDAERYSFERLVIKPDRKPLRFTFWIYKERVPHEVIINRAKVPPVAIISYSPKSFTSSPFNVKFSGLASYDPDGGPIVKYEWVIDGNNAGTNPEFMHTFAQQGNHKVKLTVTDDENQIGSTEITLWIGIGTSPPGGGPGGGGDGNGPSGGLPPTGHFDFIYVPVNWSGSNAEFEQEATAQYEKFIKGAGIENCQNKPTKHIIQPDPNNCEIPQLKHCMYNNAEIHSVLNKIVTCAQNAGFTINSANTRVIGITSSDICVGGHTGVLGYTLLGNVSVVGEAGHREVTAHELGHTFYFCEQYSQSEWKDQNIMAAPVGGCQNYYPDGTTHCKEYGNLTTHCPEMPGKKIDCKGRKIPVNQAIGRSIMGPGLPQTIPRLFDCFEQEEIKKVTKC